MFVCRRNGCQFAVNFNFVIKFDDAYFSAFFSEFYQPINLVLRDKLKECTLKCTTATSDSYPLQFFVPDNSNIHVHLCSPE
jgi:hypothetical protein